MDMSRLLSVMGTAARLAWRNARVPTMVVVDARALQPN